MRTFVALVCGIGMLCGTACADIDPEIRAKAESGDAAAQFSLGDHHSIYSELGPAIKLGDRGYFEEGLAFDSKDMVEAVGWYRKAAEQGHAGAQTNLAICYRGGLGGLAKDRMEAIKWFHKAAEQGDKNAQFFLGLLYFGNDGLAKDPKEAVKWFGKSAEQGDLWAQYRLGYCYANGVGVVKDPVEGVKWIRQAAEQDLAEAQFDLGTRYRIGDGVAKDETEGLAWWALSCRLMDFYAQVRERMPAEVITAHRKRVAELEKLIEAKKGSPREPPSL